MGLHMNLNPDRNKLEGTFLFDRDKREETGKVL
jgi:hypothetical protein